jgi:hypothetical protein
MRGSGEESCVRAQAAAVGQQPTLRSARYVGWSPLVGCALCGAKLLGFVSVCMRGVFFFFFFFFFFSSSSSSSSLTPVFFLTLYSLCLLFLFVCLLVGWFFFFHSPCSGLSEGFRAPQSVGEATLWQEQSQWNPGHHRSALLTLSSLSGPQSDSTAPT